MKRAPRILATRHVMTAAPNNGIVITRQVLDRAPVAALSPVEVIMAGWWQRGRRYPGGRRFGTLLASAGAVRS